MQALPVFYREFKPPGWRLRPPAGAVDAHAERTQAFPWSSVNATVSENLTVWGHSLDDLVRSSEYSS